MKAKTILYTALITLLISCNGDKNNETIRIDGRDVLFTEITKNVDESIKKDSVLGVKSKSDKKRDSMNFKLVENTLESNLQQTSSLLEELNKNNSELIKNIEELKINNQKILRSHEIMFGFLNTQPVRGQRISRGLFLKTQAGIRNLTIEMKKLDKTISSLIDEAIKIKQSEKFKNRRIM